MTKLLELYYLVLKLSNWQLKDHTVVEGSLTISLLKRCFLLSLFYLYGKNIFCDVLTIGVSAALLRGTCDKRFGDE